MSAFMRERGNRLLPLALVSAALPLPVCLSAPLEIFAVNTDELAFSMVDFLPFCALIWAAAALVTAAVLYLVPEKVWRVLCPVAAMTALMLFLQGTYLNAGHDFLPGDNMAVEPASAGLTAGNACLWLAALGIAAGSAFLKKGDLARLGSILLAVVVIGTQLAAMTASLLTGENITASKYALKKQADPDYVPQSTTFAGLTELGEKNNVVVFIVDRFDETYAEGAYYQDDESVFDELTGFTWFQDDVSMYGHTYPAVTWMLTGAPYSPETDRLTYQTTAFQGDTPLKRLSDAGYTIDLYTSAYYVYDDAAYLPAYVANRAPNLVEGIPVRCRFETAGAMIRVALFRCLPFLLKGVTGELDSDVDVYYLDAVTPEDTSTLDMKSMFERVTGEDFTLEGERSFHFIHMLGCHDIVYNEQWEDIKDQASTDYNMAVRSSFRIIDRYLQEMKRLGVYEDATIIITGDHAAPLNDWDPLTGIKLTALFVKPSGAGSEPLKISMAPVSHEDLWPTIFQSEGLDPGPDAGRSVFQVPEGEQRTRYYYWHTYISGANKRMDEYIYEINGVARAFPNWEIVEHNHYDKFVMD